MRFVASAQKFFAFLGLSRLQQKLLSTRRRQKPLVEVEVSGIG
jgi:hypothetical protein